jgi:Ca2+-binding RTX toxin-like protein
MKRAVARILLVSAVLLALAGGVALAASFTGTDGDDVIFGTNDSDDISGLKGHDRLHGRGGNDILGGGEGHDVVFGGLGNDVLRVGGRGDDRIGSMDRDRDVVNCGPGDDRVTADSRDLVAPNCEVVRIGEPVQR